MKYKESCLTDSHNLPVIKAFFSTVQKGKREYRKHFHPECEISTFLSGSGIYTVGSKKYAFNAGDVFVFSGNEAHCITEIHEEFKLLNIHFMPSVLLSNGGDLSLLKIFFARNNNFENKIDSSNPALKNLHNKIIDIEKELCDKKEGYKTQARYNLFSAFVSLIRDFDYIDESVSYSGYRSSLSSIDKALKFIDENIDSPLTLEEIAKEAAMIPSYFSTVFKKINGVSPFKYITIRRVEKAIELIKTTNLTKLDIAMQCGFQSSSNFYKAFLSVTGKKPKDFK